MRQMIFFVWAILLSLLGMAQAAPSLLLSEEKTTSLVFPSSIVHVDRGAPGIVAETVRENDHILLVRASGSFQKSNLTVITAEGSVYAFAVSPGDPLVWVYQLSSQGAASVKSYSDNILDNPRVLHGVKRSSWDITLRVTGIYSKQGALYFQLKLENGGPLDYDIDFLRFTTRDLKRSRRTASQQVERWPLYVAGNNSKIAAYSRHSIVVALGRFTMADRQFLSIEMGEKNGGRNLSLRLGNAKLMKARILTDLQ